MANLMDGDWNTIFNKNYEGKFQNIQENLLVHHSESPYQDRSPKKIKTAINILNGKTNTVINDFNNRSEKIVSDMREKEAKMAVRLGIFCVEQLSLSGFNPTELKEYTDGLKNNIRGNFIVGIKYLNKLFLLYSKTKMGNLLDERGYYDSEKFFNQDDIKEIMSDTFNQFIKIFTTDENATTINKTHFNKTETEKSFFKTINSFLDKQKKAESSGQWEIAAAYEGIINYCVGRGVSLIDYLKDANKKIDSFDTIRDDLKTRAGKSRYKYSSEMQLLISKANKHTVHTTIRKKDGNETIEGSFEGSITSPNQGGIILEYLDTLLLNTTYKANLNGKVAAKSINTGRISNVLGKAQKNDILATIGLSLDAEPKKEKEIFKEKELTPKDLINKNYEQIGISVKNYRAGSDIAVHSAGSLKTITNFLRTYNTVNPTSVEDFCSYLDSTMVQYFLINEIDNSNSPFLKALKDSLAKQGAVFTLTPYILNTKRGLVDESVDFFLIDQVLIPGSLIMEYALRALELGKMKTVNNNSLKSEVGYTTKITGTKPDDYELQNYSHSIEKGTKGKDFPYGRNYLSRFELGEKVFNKITFRIEMRASFKRNLQKLITNVGG